MGTNADEAAQAGRGSRRDLLPDIEEINSSLRPDARVAEAQADGELDTAQGRADGEGGPDRSGFRIGFLTVAALVGAMVAIYLLAAPIAEAVPTLADPLAGYVETVDRLRTSLAAQVDALALRVLSEP